jgi:hypothetical protein
VLIFLMAGANHFGQYYLKYTAPHAVPPQIPNN